MSGGLDLALWDLGRATGVVALVLFTMTVVLGIIGRSGRPALGVGRFGVQELHRTVALTGVGLLAVHVFTLLLDPFAQLRLLDIVVPFVGRYRPFWLGLGTTALDTLAVVVVSALMRHRIGPRLFKILHWGTYALWPMAFLHVLGAGSDAGNVWLRVIAFTCLAIVVLTLGWRLTPGYAERGVTRIPRRVTR